MKIRLTKRTCGPDTALNGAPGDVMDVSTATAKDWIADGAAVALVDEAKRTATMNQDAVEKRNAFAKAAKKAGND